MTNIKRMKILMGLLFGMMGVLYIVSHYRPAYHLINQDCNTSDLTIKRDLMLLKLIGKKDINDWNPSEKYSGCVRCD